MTKRNASDAGVPRAVGVDFQTRGRERGAVPHEYGRRPRPAACFWSPYSVYAKVGALFGFRVNSVERIGDLSACRALLANRVPDEILDQA
jgi:hypothetical protein